MRITDVTGYYLSSNYGDGKVFGQPLGIKSIGIVEVHTNDNIVGIGETYAGIYAPELIGPTIDFIKRLIIGEDPTDIELVLTKMNIPFISSVGFIRNVISAIEISLWDIRGQMENKPIYQLLSDSVNLVTVYASGGSVQFSPDEIKRDVDNILRLGHTRYKMRIGYQQQWQDDIQRIKSCEQLLPNNLMADCIMGTLNKWDLPTAISRLKELEEFNLAWIEEPLHPSNLLGVSQLTNSVNSPIAMGESLSGPEFDGYIYHSGIQYIQPDVTQCGGYLQAMKIIKKARAEDIKVALHVWGSAISQLANLHLAIALHVDFYEIPMVELQLSDDLKEPFMVDNGILNYDVSGSGLGINLTEEIKNKYSGIKNSGYQVGNRM